MAKQNRDQNVGGSQQGGGAERTRGQEQSAPSRDQRDREQVTGGSTSSPEQSERPQRQPGRLPLPD